MSLRDEQIQAARDALDIAGEPVSFRATANAAVTTIQAKIKHGVEIYDAEGRTKRVTILSAIKSDVAALSKSSTFEDGAGDVFRYLETLQDNNIRIRLLVQRNASVQP